MEKHEAAKPMVWVKDKAGNEYICEVKALKDPKNATEAELKECIDDARRFYND